MQHGRREAACQAALNQALADEAAAQAQLSAQQGKSATLSQAIASSRPRSMRRGGHKAKNILIQTLGSNIADDQSHISDLEAISRPGSSLCPTFSANE